MSNILLGDAVCLKSGGPAMTVKRLDEANDQAFCVWFTKQEDLADAWFPLKTLRHQDDNS